MLECVLWKAYIELISTYWSRSHFYVCCFCWKISVVSRKITSILNMTWCLAFFYFYDPSTNNNTKENNRKNGTITLSIKVQNYILSAFVILSRALFFEFCIPSHTPIPTVNKSNLLYIIIETVLWTEKNSEALALKIQINMF